MHQEESTTLLITSDVELNVENITLGFPVLAANATA